jgi:Rieske Fe-S protein
MTHDGRPIDRRTVIKHGVCCLGIGAGLGGHQALVLAQTDKTTLRPQAGDVLIKNGDAALTPLRPEDVPLAAMQTLAWAMEPADKIVRNGSRLNLVLLVRFESAKLADETRGRAADGVVAYTAICPHNGCEVDEWVPEEQILYCPCHASKFDPRNGAKVVDGPAPRVLPALPLKTVDGILVVAGSFTARVGFETE